MKETIFTDDGKPFDMDKMYTVATVEYMAKRKEGWTDPSVEDLTGDIDEAITNKEIIRCFLKDFQKSD